MKSKKGCILSILLVLFIFGVTIPLFMTNHKKIKADTISDLTNTTWTINSNINVYNAAYSFPVPLSINLTLDNTYGGHTSGNNIRSLDEDGDYFIQLYNDNNQVDDIIISWGYGPGNVLHFTGGTDVTNSSLISWLQTYATLDVPTPTGTEITNRYWSPYGVITMQDNQRIGDNDIEYTVLFNEYNRSYDETTQTGLIFTGVLTNQEPAWSYIESINGSGINILYHGETNNINNAMWLEFTPGDYIDTNLYNFMDLWGYWFDDDDAYLVGMNQGYVEGVEHGRALGQADGVEYTGLITGIFNGLGNILSIQVFPNITIGLLIGLPLLLGALIIILKILRG